MKTLAFAAAATLLAGAAHAQSYTETGGSSVTLGAAVVATPEYSGSDDYKTYVLPLIFAETDITPGNKLYIKGLTSGWDHTVDEQLTVGLMGQYRFKRDSGDSANLAGMPDIDAAFEVGPKVRYQASEQLGFEANMLFDTTNSYDGFTARAGADYGMPLSAVTMLKIRGGVNYGSEDYMGTYYGVTAGQAKPNRRAYSPNGGISHVDASAEVRHMLTHNWSLQAGVGAEYLLGDAADSPLVKDELQPRAMLGVAYSF